MVYLFILYGFGLQFFFYDYLFTFSESYFGGKRSDCPEGTVDQQQSTRHERHDHGHASKQSCRIHRGSKQDTCRT